MELSLDSLSVHTAITHNVLDSLSWVSTPVSFSMLPPDLDTDHPTGPAVVVFDDMGYLVVVGGITFDVEGNTWIAGDVTSKLICCVR